MRACPEFGLWDRRGQRRAFCLAEEGDSVLERRREWATAIIGYAMGLVIALAVAPPIASYLDLDWSFDVAEMPFWGRLIADMFVLGTGLVVAGAGYLAAKTG